MTPFPTTQPGAGPLRARRTRLGVVTACAALASLALAPAAFADATIYQMVGTSGLAYDGDATANTVDVAQQRAGAPAGSISFKSSTAGKILAGSCGKGSDTPFSANTWVDCTGAGSPVLYATLRSGADTLRTQDVSLPMRIDGGAGADTLEGGSNDDTIGNDFLTFGDDDAAADTFTGKGGDDSLDGGDGNDTLDGGAGNDTLVPGDGNDTVMGGTGDEGVVDGGQGVDAFSYDDGRTQKVSVILNNGTAQLDGGADDNASATAREALVGFEKLTGSPAGDELTGSTARDELHGAGGADTIKGGTGNDQLFGGAGNDTLDGGENADAMRGEDGVDTVDYSSRTEDLSVRLYGAASGSTVDDDDTLLTGSMNDTLSSIETVLGGSGDDDVRADALDTAGVRLEGNAGSDRLVGAKGADTLIGGTGDDTLDGQEGNDSLRGGDDRDALNGHAGDDTLLGEGGRDLLSGGPDRDTVSYATRTEPLSVTIGAGTDDDGGASDDVGGHRDEVMGDVEVVLGGSAADTLIGDGDPEELDGGGGNDTVRGRGGADVLKGGAGKDILDYSERGSTQPVQVSLDGVVNDGIVGENDQVSDFEAVVGGSGDDILSAPLITTGAELTGNGGDDKLIAPAKGGTLSGGAGADELTGGAAADTLDGGDGPDKLDGHGGIDTVRGGAGADLIEARDGLADTVDCGADADSAQLDSVDKATGCEPPVTPVTPVAPVTPVTPPADPAPVIVTVPPPAGSPAPVAPQMIPATVAYEVAKGRKFTTIKRLVVRNLVTDSTVVVTCKSKTRKGCPKKSLTKRGSFAVAVKELAGKRLPAGTTLTFRVTATGWVGVVKTMTFRKSRMPVIKTQCLPPGAAKPGAC